MSRRLLAQAIEEEVEAFLFRYKDLQNKEGYQRLVRNGFLPEREIQTGVGPVLVKMPRIRDRDPRKTRIHFSSGILPKYLRRTTSKDMSEALTSLGANGTGFSASTVSRLKEVWQQDLEWWNRRDLTGKRFVYFWVDGVYFHVRAMKTAPAFS